MEKHDIGDDLRLRRLGGTGTEPVKYTRSHITAVRGGQRTPDIADQTNQGGEDQDRSSAVGRLNWDPAHPWNVSDMFG